MLCFLCQLKCSDYYVCSVSLCCSVYCLCVNVYWITATGISEHFPTTLTEVFPCFFLSCKTNVRGTTRKDRARPALPKFLLFIAMHIWLKVQRDAHVFVCILYFTIFALHVLGASRNLLQCITQLLTYHNH
jgi:hypothetical protein